jgi:hypothetical protein
MQFKTFRTNGYKILGLVYSEKMFRIDINECTLGTDDCDADVRATCTNIPGSFTCACKDGYSGDGKTCVGS